MPEAQTEAARFLLRFGSTFNPEVKVESDIFVQRLVKNYQQYWWEALTKLKTTKQAELDLKSRLLQLLLVEGWSIKDLQTEAQRDIAIIQSLKKRHLFVLLGRTQPLLELLIWSRETQSSYRVDLVEDSIDVRVIFLENFIVGGWGK